MKSLEQVCKVSLDNERKVSKAIDKIINALHKMKMIIELTFS